MPARKEVLALIPWMRPLLPLLHEISSDIKSLVTIERTGLQVTHTPFRLHETVPDPKCGTQQVWDAARGVGAPADAVAILDYRRAPFEAAGQWRFRIDGTDLDLKIEDPGCQIVRVPLERYRGRSVEQEPAPR